MLSLFTLEGVKALLIITLPLFKLAVQVAAAYALPVGNNKGSNPKKGLYRH